MTHKTFILLIKISLIIIVCLFSGSLFAHGVDDATKQFLANNQGVAVAPFIYIGAKHMITGYDHLLFLVGVIFFLFKPKDVLIYVSFFTIGHSITLLYGVFSDIKVNPYLIDAIIGLSVVYKGFDNLGGFKKIFGKQPNAKMAVLLFGLFHGFGLATKLQEFNLPKEGLVPNLLSFNLGVEIGQFIALGLILVLMTFWRSRASFKQFATITNTLLMSCGLMLMGFQLTGYFLSS